jgi:hypothetical protein
VIRAALVTAPFEIVDFGPQGKYAATMPQVEAVTLQQLVAVALLAASRHYGSGAVQRRVR